MREQTAEQTLLRMGLKIELVQGRSAIQNCCICDEDFIRQDLEELALEATEDESTGIFIKSPEGIVVVTAIVQPCEEDAGSMELQLLCANTRVRVRGAAMLVLKHVAEKALAWGFRTVVLSVAHFPHNIRAQNFYESIGMRHAPGPGPEHFGRFVGDAAIMAKARASGSPPPSAPRETNGLKVFTGGQARHPGGSGGGFRARMPPQKHTAA
jgi:GNAT superfamily N-acetyltransferase